MKFTKMQGAGNDYVYVDCTQNELKNASEVAVAVSDRHFGIGSDGLILICPSDHGDCRMRMFNADGSEGEMCGNAIRCVGKYLYDKGIIKKEYMTIETAVGVKSLLLYIRNGKANTISVGMGKADLDTKSLPTTLPGSTIINRPVDIADGNYNITCASVGNPHCVTVVEDVDSLKLEAIGPAFEHHANFPERINTEFVQVVDAAHLKMRVWERGSGETWACGTGTCATVAALTELGICPAGQDIHVQLRGGELVIRVLPGRQLLMTGSAVTVYEGVAEV